MQIKESCLNAIKHATCSEKEIVLSLSGGVDSMVCLHVLQKNRIPFTALHVNYMNRPESHREEEFVRSWCALRGVTCHVRRMTEVQRPQCMRHGLRAEYEEYTKKQRFGAYAQLGARWVVMGHNRDDVLENVISNIKAGAAKLDNLHGMSDHGQQQGLEILRPLCGVMKKDIFKFARENGIPYLKNTTPVWAARYYIRNTLAPALEQFGATEGFIKLADACKEMSGIVWAYMKDCAQSCVKDDGTKWIQCAYDHPLLCSETFARGVMFHLFGLHISRKSMSNYMECIARLKGGLNKNGKQTVMVKRGYSVFVERLPQLRLNETVMMLKLVFVTN